MNEQDLAKATLHMRTKFYFVLSERGVKLVTSSDRETRYMGPMLPGGECEPIEDVHDIGESHEHVGGRLTQDFLGWFEAALASERPERLIVEELPRVVIGKANGGRDLYAWVARMRFDVPRPAVEIGQVGHVATICEVAGGAGHSLELVPSPNHQASIERHEAFRELLDREATS